MQKDQDKKTLRQMVQGNLFILRLIWKADKARVLLAFFTEIFGFGMWAFQTVFFLRYLFGTQEFDRPFGEIVVFMAVVMGVWAVYQGLTAWFWERRLPLSDQRLHRSLHGMLFAKAMNVELQCYEDQDFYERYTRAASDLVSRSSGILDNTARLLASLLSACFVVGNLFFIHPYIGLASLFPLLVNLVTGLKQGKATYNREMEYVPCRRRQEYVDRAVYLQKYAKDIRMTRMYDVLAKNYDEATKSHISVTKRYWKKLVSYAIFRDSVVYSLFFESIWLFGAYMAMVPGTITVSDFVVVANSVVSSTFMLMNITGSLVDLLNNALYVDNLRAFLAYKETIPEDQEGIPAPAQIETLELRHVYFRYRKDGAYVLSDINLVLHGGDIIAFVGRNGSGKSTLSKLIMRLYDPTEGEILLNGVDIRRYHLQQYRQLIGVAFQDYQIFAMSVRDNIAMGNCAPREEAAVAREALERSGAAGMVDAFENGLSTVLTKEFDEDGRVLSGGEEQKIVAARAFAKNGRILLMDEPSSALDPIAEYQMYEALLRLCRDVQDQKICIFISHRLSSAAGADVICLLEDGRIAEQGTHRQLMGQNGVYADMFRKQAANYLMEVKEA